MSVRLWSWWPGPDAQYPPGEVVEVEPAVAVQICSAEGGEIVGPVIETAALAPRQQAVKHKRKKRKRL